MWRIIEDSCEGAYEELLENNSSRMIQVRDLIIGRIRKQPRCQQSLMQLPADPSDSVSFRVLESADHLDQAPVQLGPSNLSRTSGLI